MFTSKANFNLKYFLPSFSREREQGEKINWGQKENLHPPSLQKRPWKSEFVKSVMQTLTRLLTFSEPHTDFSVIHNEKI